MNATEILERAKAAKSKFRTKDYRETVRHLYDEKSYSISDIIWFFDQQGLDVTRSQIEYIVRSAR